MSKRYYAGIGSRETPLPILKNMTQLASKLNTRDWSLRSGGADGADTAFEEGANIYAEIFKPVDATPAAIVMAEKFHPNWAACNPYVRRLHARNCQIMLGRHLRNPVVFVVCWTHRGRPVGGTGQSIRMAREMEIPILNLGKSEMSTIQMLQWVSNL